MVEKYLELNLSSNTLDNNYKTNIEKFLLEQIKDINDY